MKCPTCVEEGLKSTLRSRGTMSTLMAGGEAFYDENGKLHRHEPNVSTTAYECSNGHISSVSFIPPCPTQECVFNKDDLVGNTKFTQKEK